MRIGLHKDNYVDANSMTREVEVYAPNIYEDGQGGTYGTMSYVTTVWGDFRPQPQSRTILEGQQAFPRYSKLFIRWDLSINDTYQFQVEGQRYTVHSIKDVDNAHRFWEIEMYAV